jgi:hypothetical protein
MALIEIPNAYSSDMAASASGRSRLAIVGELIVAVDLINTVAVPGSAVTNDLLSAERGAAAWWRVETARVPGGGLPDIHALRRLRSALRDVIEALVADRPVPQGAVSDLNFFTHAAPASTRLRLAGTGLLAETHWHGSTAGIRGWRSSPPRPQRSCPTLRRSASCGAARTRPVR